MEKLSYKDKGYWKDWYWNKGGREKVQEKRRIRELKAYEEERAQRKSDSGS